MDVMMIAPGGGEEQVSRTVTTVAEDAPRWCTRLIAEFKACDERAVAVARDLTPEQLNAPPRPGSWSVGQCLEHLHIANVVYCPPIEAALVGRARAPVQEITPGWLARWFIRTVIEPGPQQRPGRAPRKIKPAPVIDADILERFLRSNETTRALVHRARDLDVNRIRFRNPFVGVLRWSVGAGFEILVRHQRRHLRQAERVRATLRATASTPGAMPSQR